MSFRVLGDGSHGFPEGVFRIITSRVWRENAVSELDGIIRFLFSLLFRV